MRRAVVTGASGFLGRHLVAELRSSGWSTATVSRTPQKLTDADYALGAEPWGVAALTTMLDTLTPDVVFHMVGMVHADFVSDLFETNTLLTARLLDAANRRRVLPDPIA